MGSIRCKALCRASAIEPGAYRSLDYLPRYGESGKGWIMSTVTLYRFFLTSKEAREYRYQHGTGGWIFAPDNGEESILFPPEYPPSYIFQNVLTKGRSGQLIGAM